MSRSEVSFLSLTTDQIKFDCFIGFFGVSHGLCFAEIYIIKSIVKQILNYLSQTKKIFLLRLVKMTKQAMISLQGMAEKGLWWQLNLVSTFLLS